MDILEGIIIFSVFLFVLLSIIMLKDIMVLNMKRKKAKKMGAQLLNVQLSQATDKVNKDDTLKGLLSTIKSVGNLHTIYRPQLIPFVESLMEAGTDIVLIGVEEYRNGKSQAAVIIMKSGFIGSNCCSNVYFDKKLGEVEPYHLTAKHYVQSVTHKKNQSVIGSAVAGSIVAGNIGAIIGATHAQSVNGSGGKTVQSYVPTPIYNLMVGGNRNPLTCLTHIAVKKSILGARFKELEVAGNKEYILLKVGQCTQEQATELINFFNSK